MALMQLDRNPTLESVLMVEEACKKHSGEYTKTQLWKALPRSMQYQTFATILDYLRHNNKIAIDKKGVVVWVWDPEGVKYYLEHKELAWRK